MKSAQLHTINRLLNGRTMEEVLLKVEECKNCKHFSFSKCNLRDEIEYCKTLAVGHCPEWDYSIADRFVDVNDGRIKLVFPTIALLCGGAERWLVDLATGLDKKKYCVCIAIEEIKSCDKDLLSRAYEYVDYIVFGRKNLRKVCDAADISLSWCYFPDSKAKYKVFCSHGCDCWTEKLVEENKRLSSYHFTAVSSVAADPWRHLGNPTIIYNGCDFKRTQPTGLDVRKKLRISNDTILIGFLSRLIPAKNPQLVAIAAHELRNRGYDARAIFVGDGPAKQYDNCIYVPRVEAIGDYLAAMSCFMLPSDSEAFSLAITEAWLAKVPVIATPVGAIIELEEKYGPMVTRLTTNLTEAVLWAISPRNTPTVLNAYDVAFSNFTKESMISRWEKYFDGLTKR